MKLLAALGALVLLAEIGLRALGFQAPLWYRPDAELGWTLRPGVQGLYKREGRGEVAVNAAGLRDREHLLDKPEGTYRIAVLGDSLSEALQVDVQQAYWRLLPARLAQCGFQGGKKLEVLNFAVAGYGTAQQYVMLQTRALRYRPDLVLLQFSSADDVQNNSFALAREKARPFFMLDDKGVLRIDESFAAAEGFRRRASLPHQVGRRAADFSRLAQFALEVDSLGLLMKPAHAGDVQTALLVPPRDSLWEEAWRVTEALLLDIHFLSVKNGARLVVFTAPHPAQLGALDYSYPDNRLAAFAGNRGIEVLGLTEALRRAPRPLYYQRHWNPAGHRAVADALAARLCQ